MKRALQKAFFPGSEKNFKFLVGSDKLLGSYTASKKFELMAISQSQSMNKSNRISFIYSLGRSCIRNRTSKNPPVCVRAG